MAGKDLTYRIGIDASDATGSLQKFGSAVRSTMRQVEDELDEGATAGTKLATALDRLSDQMREDFNSASIAADEMGRALQAVGSKLNVADVLPQLQRMGLSFDEITQEADQLAAALKQLDDVKMAGIADLDARAPGLATKIDDVGRSADQTRSVMANLVGNSAQDLGQLGSVAGSAGVAIGQLAEYAADGNISVAGLAKLAGPMLALGVATLAVSQHMEGIKLNKEFNAKQVEDMVDAMRQAQTAASALTATMEETGKLDFSVAKQGLFAIGQEVRDITPDLAKFGLTLEQFQAIAEEGGGMAELANLILEAGTASGKLGESQTKAFKRISEAVDEYGENLEQAKRVQEAYNRVHTVSAAAVRDAAAAFRQAQDPTAAYADEFERIAEAIATGAVPAARDLETVTEGLGITMAEAFALGQGIVDEHTEAVTANNEKMEEARERQREFADAVGLAEAGLAGAIDEADAFAAALERVNESSELDFAQMAQDTVGSFDDVKNALDGIEDSSDIDWSNFDITPDEYSELKGMPDSLRSVTDAVAGMRGSIQTELAAAFETGGIDAYTEKATFFRDEILAQFPQKFRDMGASEEEAAAQTQALLADLGLLPTDIQIMIELTREEEARAALDAFSGVISKLPENVQVAIQTALAEGDVAAALEILNTQLINRGYDPITLPVDADTALADEKVEGIAGAELEPATIPLDADPSDAEDERDGFVDDTERTKPVVGIQASVREALITMAIINLVAALMKPTVNISANAAPALATLNALQRLTPKVGAEVYIADAPTAGEIQRMIGRPRIPVDLVVGQSIRITGVRD